MCPHDTILDITQRSDTEWRGICDRCGQAEWHPENQEETR